MAVTFLTNEDKAELETSIKATEEDINILKDQYIKNNVHIPQMYGAIGDGVTDDTKAIQDAIDSAQSDGGTVYLPVGKYLVTSTITVKKGVTVEGVAMSYIRPTCDTVFYMERETCLEGFKVHILPEYSSVVNTVFLVNQSSRMTGTGGVAIRFSNLSIVNSATEANDNFTVWDIHSADGASEGTSSGAGYSSVYITDCMAKNNTVMGYAARIYSYKTDWVSSVLVKGCTTSTFKWHWFFMPSEELCHSADYSVHNSNCVITDCCGQWGQGTKGFVYAANSNTLRLFNNMPWDWGSQTNTGVKSPYIFNEAFYKTGSLHTDIATIDGNFGVMLEDGTVEREFNSISWRNRIFHVAGESKYRPRAIGLGGLSANSPVKAALLYANSYGGLSDVFGSIRFTLIDEYGRRNHVILTTTSAYVDFIDNRYAFACSSDYKNFYITCTSGTSGNIPRNLIAISEPLVGNIYAYAYRTNGRPAGAKSINVFNKTSDEVYFAEMPEDLIELPKIVNPNNNVIYSPNGTAYQITVDDNGTLTANIASKTALYDV